MIILDRPLLKPITDIRLTNWRSGWERFNEFRFFRMVALTVAAGGVFWVLVGWLLLRWVK